MLFFTGNAHKSQVHQDFSLSFSLVALVWLAAVIKVPTSAYCAVCNIRTYVYYQFLAIGVGHNYGFLPGGEESSSFLNTLYHFGCGVHLCTYMQPYYVCSTENIRYRLVAIDNAIDGVENVNPKRLPHVPRERERSACVCVGWSRDYT